MAHGQYFIHNFNPLPWRLLYYTAHMQAAAWAAPAAVGGN